jgi:hypothetical protein
MVRSRIRAALAALALLGLCSTACDVKGFRVQLPAFQTAEVLGLWIWRASPQTGEFERFAQIEFGSLVEEGGSEFLPYSVTIAGSPVTFNARVTRPPAAPEDVTLSLAFGPALGTFKISSYNAVGESPLSEGTLVY